MRKIVIGAIGVIAFGAAIAVAYGQSGTRVAPAPAPAPAAVPEQVFRYSIALSVDGKTAWRIDTVTGAVSRCITSAGSGFCQAWIK
jgi:hypothetical protein